MNKYLKAVLLFLFYWVIVGTGITVILSLFGINLDGIGSIIGFILGIYFAVVTIKSK
ncbi:MAG: hypothetical protein M1405_03385 [Patescibacteria group bacterium]|nr:hypothetical protein [Patescibacteria group bacterium]